MFGQNLAFRLKHEDYIPVGIEQGLTL